jgi:predicted ferric reductase
MEDLRRRKTIVVTAIVATSLLPLAFLRFDEPRFDLNVYKLLAKAGSLSGTVLIFWQFLLGFRRLVSRVIVDLIWAVDLHKQIGRYILLLVVLHPTFITIYYVIKEGVNPLTLELGGSRDVYVALGMLALLLFALVVATSVWLRQRLGFVKWYSMHLSTYVALPLALIHSIALGQTIRGTGLGILWLVLLAMVVAVYFYRLACRLGLGIYRHTVVRVRDVGRDVAEISARPDDEKVEPEVGQFVYFRRGRAGMARPFTVSCYDPPTGELAVTVKAQGKGTTAMQSTQPGEKVFVDGPYGVFLHHAFRSERPFVLIAGGIGITPFYRLLHDWTGQPGEQLFLFYGNRYREEIVYQQEIEALEHVRVIHVLSDEEDYPGETGFITPDLLKKYLPRELADYEFLICGPPAMTAKLEAALGERGVPREQIHHELFSF